MGAGTLIPSLNKPKCIWRNLGRGIFFRKSHKTMKHNTQQQHKLQTMIDIN